MTPSFRLSQAGACMRSLVLSNLRPEENEPEPHRLPFLEIGHDFQDKALRRLQQDIPGILWDGEEWGIEPYWIGPDGSPGEEQDIDWGGYRINSGHFDAAYERGKWVDLLEVKALSVDWFNKLKAGQLWQEVYPSHWKQVNLYCSHRRWTRLPPGHEKTLADWGECRIEENEFKFSRIRMVYVNRSSFEILGGIPARNVQGYTYVPSMNVTPQKRVAKMEFARFAKAAEYVRRQEVPACDAAGWCFRCQAVGEVTSVDQPRRKSSEGVAVSFDRPEEGLDGDVEILEAYLDWDKKSKEAAARRDELKLQVQALFKQTKAGKIIAPSGEIQRIVSQSVTKDSAVINDLVAAGKIPTTVKETVSFKPKHY